jgi:uridine kinase
MKTHLQNEDESVCSDDDVRLARRIQRDVVERGRTMEDVLQQYKRFVKPSHDDFIAPSKRVADIVIPWHKSDNLVAVDLIVGAYRGLSCDDRLDVHVYVQIDCCRASKQASTNLLL